MKPKYKVVYSDRHQGWVIKEKIWWCPIWLYVGEDIDILPMSWNCPLVFKTYWEAFGKMEELESWR